MAKRSFYARFAWPILIAHVILIPIICISAIRAVKSNRNDVSDWLPKNYDETRELAWFRDHFIDDQFVLLSWDGCTLGEDPSGDDDDPRIAQLIEELKKAQLPREHEAGSDPVFKPEGITTGRTVLQQLMSPPSEMGRRAATERLKGSLIGPDGKQTVIMANLTPQASKRLRAAMGRPAKRFGLIKHEPSPMWRAILATGLTEDQVRLGGPPIDNNAIDEEGENSLVKLAGLAGLLGLGLSYYSLRSIRMTIVVFMCGVLSAALSLAIVRWSGFSMDAILMSMPALIYVLAVSGAVHIVNYYRQAVIHHGFDNAIERAIRHAWKPAFLCSITTGIGLASLHTSSIIPIAKFGDFSAVGVFAMLIILFLFLPAMLKLWPWVPTEMRGKSAAAAAAEGRAQEHAADHAGEGWARFGMWVDRHHNAVAIACFLFIGLLCIGLPRVRTSIDLLKLFSEDARLLDDYRWFEKHLGKIVPVELVLRFPLSTMAEADDAANLKPGQLVARHTFLERMEFVERLQHSLESKLGDEEGGEGLIGATMAVTTFAPDVGGEGSGTGTGTRRHVVNENLLKNRPGFEKSGFLRVDKEHEGADLWRVSVRVAAFTEVDQGMVVQHIREAVEPVLTARSAAVTALKRLAQIRGGQPSGARVIYWHPNDAKLVAEDVAPFLASKNVRAFGLETPIADMDDDKLAELTKMDGVVLGPGFTNGDVQRLRNAKVNVLAVYDRIAEQRIADAAAAKANAKPFNDVAVIYSGVVPVVYKAQRELLNSLIQSTAWSFGTITPLMMYVCGGVLAGLVVILPNALPILVVFGGMGWLDIPVDIGSMMAASIALGVAVDDTIHFLAWFNDDFVALGDRRLAVLSAYRRSATATLQAALINGLGLSVFATSSFTPTKRFGWLMLTILVAGMVAELIMCPSLLFGPMGKVFEKKRKKPGHSEPDEQADHLHGESALSPPAGVPRRMDNGAAAANERPHAAPGPHSSQARRHA